VRKVYLKALAVNPRLKVSAATVAWGTGPQSEADWVLTRAYAEVFQDWRSWLEEGIVDLVLPMNYDREWEENQRRWYDQWLEWEKNHQYSRQVVVGVGAYQQYPEESLAQIRRALAPSTQGQRAAGVALYAYASSNLYATDSYANPNSPAARRLPRQPHTYRPETNAAFPALLSQEGSYLDPATGVLVTTAPVFPAPAPQPDLPWKSRPVKGFLMGAVSEVPGRSLDHLKVTLTGPETREVYTDGRGWFGAADLLPGEYVVQVAGNDAAATKQVAATVEPGRVTEVTWPAPQ
jgi:hypothetical protein